ncbi:hypothetical protein ACLB2K_053189 [Fragaria x ananassa]
MKMFTALIEDGNFYQALEHHKHIVESDVQPMVVVHTCVIEAYLKFGKTKGALEAYWGMLAAGVAPNTCTYTVLIKGLTADPNFLGDAKKCLLEMMDKGMRPNAATYTVVIESFAKQEDKASEEECKDLVGMMMGKGFVPNAKAMMEVLNGRPTPVRKFTTKTRCMGTLPSYRDQGNSGFRQVASDESGQKIYDQDWAYGDITILWRPR